MVDIGLSFAHIPGRSAYSIISLSRCSWVPLTKAKRALSCRQDPRKICIQHYIAIKVFKLRGTIMPPRSREDLHASLYRYRGIPGCLLPKLRGHYHAAKIPGRSAYSIISLSRCSWVPLTKAKRALSCRQDPRKICIQHYITIKVFLGASYQS